LSPVFQHRVYSDLTTHNSLYRAVTLTRKPNWCKGARTTRWVYEGPSEEIYSKSTICDLL